MQRRLQRLRDVLHTEQLDGLLVTNSANRRYLSGFTGSAGSLLVTVDRALLVSDFRYREQALFEAPAFEVQLLPSGVPLAKHLSMLLDELQVGRLGLEAGHVTVADYAEWQNELTSTKISTVLTPTQGLVEQLRQTKDAGEQAVLRRAVAITDEALAAVRSLLRPTMREREVAWELEKAMRERGADGTAFEIIVASGANAAKPHARAGDEQLGIGRPIVIDCGARLDGYHADMTRTLILGEPDEQFWSVYNTVLDAQQNAAAAIRAGMTGQQADALARERITAAGFGEAFGHGLGHGVGLAIHEGPWLRQTSSDTLPVGAVCSIEPGIYLPGWGGVRIEDLVLLTDTGVDVLTQSDKHPVVNWQNN